MKNVEFLVSGGAGFIGSNIVHTLVARGRSVRVLDDFSTGLKKNIEDIADQIDIVEGDLLHEDKLDRALQGVRYVLHLAALPSVLRSVRDPVATNSVIVNGTLNLLVKARDMGIERVVYSSSSSVYGNTPVLPKEEGMRPMPLSPYAIAKLTGEHYCRVFHELYGLKTFSLRYFNVFGPRQNPHSQYAAVIPLFIDAIREGRSPTIKGDGEQTRDFTYVENVAEGNIACCTAPEEAAGKVYNIACGDRTSVNDLARSLIEMMGSDVEPEYIDPQPGDVRDSQADNRRARELLGWEPSVDFKEGLRRTIAWYNNQ